MSLILIVHIVMYAVNTRISVADMLHFPALDNSYISIAWQCFNFSDLNVIRIEFFRAYANIPNNEVRVLHKVGGLVMRHNIYIYQL